MPSFRSFRFRPSRPSTALSTALLAATLVACATTDTPSALNTERIAAIVASPDRSAADRTNDQRRKPVEFLSFVGVRPGLTALDVSAGGGYTSELLARAVGPTGRVYAQSAPPASPPPPGRRTSAIAIAERAAQPAAASLVGVARPYADPVPPEAVGSIDLVTLMFNYHDLGPAGVDRTAMNRALYAALKPGGLYVVADHAGRPGTGASEASTLHRIEETFVVREVEAAGFRLLARGTFLANPNDPRDRETPEPPQPKDEFVLKFVK